ncbi:methyltransferase domain-containing protein [Streptomyces sp. NPDC005438]|uniref:THUMP-like domain-containing protein n=1 Tax=Streptomyces sp. NPDC005438 TaxID=3156880 RepID=UPI0033BD5781
MVPGGPRAVRQTPRRGGGIHPLAHNGPVNDHPDAPLAALLSPEGQRLLAQLQDHDPAEELTLATRLRRDHPPELVSAALGQARLRQRARAKFGDRDAARMYFTPNGVEQATRATVAAHRAERFRGLGVTRVADLCCGVGGDAVALARAGLRVLAVDQDPLTCAVARANAEALGLADLIEVRCGRVEEVELAGQEALFVDPARRINSSAPARRINSPAPARGGDGPAPGGGGGRGHGGGRIFDPEAYSPPLSWAVEAARRVGVAALKVAPGIPHELVPEEAEAEWTSDRGEVKEAVLWFGTGAPGTVTATVLPSGGSLSVAGGEAALGVPEVGPVGRYLYEPDGAVVRAHLVAAVAEEVGGRLVDPTIAYVTGDARVESRFATGYEITDVLPFHVKRLRALLREREVGSLTVKKRGSAVSPEELRKKVRPSGPNAATVFLTRVAGAPTMLVGRPLP